MALVNPHGKDKKLMPLMLEGAALEAAKTAAKSMDQVKMSSRETSDLIMMGIGAFTPLTGFMGKADWKSVCEKFVMADGLFFPIPITLSTTKGQANSLKVGQEVALVDEESGEIMGSMTIAEMYDMSEDDKKFECQSVFTTTDAVEHPGAQKVMAQGDVNLAGPVKVFSEGHYPETYKGIYMRPAETRALFEAKGWNTVAAFQTRNPMHRSHEYLAKIAIETLDGCCIHMLLGKLKAGDIPADVRQKAIDTLVDNYFVKDTCVVSGYPMEMRYAGPREALLHALFRQNYGMSHLLVGRDHAGVGDFYGPFDAHHIFDKIPEGALETAPIKIDLSFYCTKCDGMASDKTCPHGKESRLIVSGTKLRKMLSEGEEVPDHFSRPEVLTILRAYYEGLTEKVEIKMHKHAETGGK
ncbi:MAG: sulfate adenylyltransferase [Nitrospirae bacterium]|nr:sulfate adenylyltransferase [Nitrospirota bacterium]